IEADTVIAAIGQRPVTAKIAEQSGVKVDRSGRIEVDAFTNETSVPVVYAGGDVVTGPSIVLAAVGAGERAAVSINEALSQDLAEEDRSTPFWRDVIPNDVPFDAAAAAESVPRMKHETLPLEKRTGFQEVELAVSKSVALKECARCLRCDYRAPANGNGKK
ncbi:MAG: FAD-dependent oxidoreductase, partial [Phycisphaerales bacterium]